MNLNDIFISLIPGFDPHAEVWGNTVGDILLTFVVFIALVVVFKLLQWLILFRLARLAKKTKTDIDDTLIDIVKSLRPQFYYFIAFALAIQILTLNTIASKIIAGLLIAWIVYQVVIAVQILIDYVLSKKLQHMDDAGDGSMIEMLGGLAKWALWVIALLLVLSNLGVNITSLVAGLGIGGLAIALAAQNILGDLFSSFSIYFDKPFKVGDHVVVGEHRGTVERIGIKTTRIRALQGEEIVISNQELTSTRVQNFKKLKERRITTSLGVTYQTSNEKLKRIPDIVKKIVDAEKGVRFDRMFFTTFADSALVFDLVYYVESSEMADFLVAQQNMNFKIKEAFEEEGIDMAYPTQTIFVAKS